ECHRITEGEGTDRRAGESGEVATTAQRRSQVMRQAPDIHPTTGTDRKTCQCVNRVVLEQTEGMNFDGPGCGRGRLAASRLPIRRLTALLERRVDGRHLRNAAGEGRQQDLDPLAAYHARIAGGREGSF